MSTLVAALRASIPNTILDYIARAPASAEPLCHRLEKQAREQAMFAALPHKNYEGHAYARLALDIAEAHDALKWRLITDSPPRDGETVLLPGGQFGVEADHVVLGLAGEAHRYREALEAVEVALEAFADEGTPGDQPLTDGERMALEALRVCRRALAGLGPKQAAQE